MKHQFQKLKMQALLPKIMILYEIYTLLFNEFIYLAFLQYK